MKQGRKDAWQATPGRKNAVYRGPQVAHGVERFRVATFNDRDHPIQLLAPDDRENQMNRTGGAGGVQCRNAVSGPSQALR